MPFYIILYHFLRTAIEVGPIRGVSQLINNRIIGKIAIDAPNGQYGVAARHITPSEVIQIDQFLNIANRMFRDSGTTWYLTLCAETARPPDT